MYEIIGWSFGSKKYIYKRPKHTNNIDKYRKKLQIKLKKEIHLIYKKLK